MTPSAGVQPPERHSCVKCQPVRLSGCEGFRTAHTLRRLYIGPSPVPAARANAAARELAADQLRSIGVRQPKDDATAAVDDHAVGPAAPGHSPHTKAASAAAPAATEGNRRADARDAGQPPDAVQYRWTDPFRPAALAVPPSAEDHDRGSTHDDYSPRVSAPPDTSFARSRPSQPVRDPSNASFASNVSFASARSMPRSVFSEMDAADRAADTEEGEASNDGSRSDRSPSSPLSAFLSSRSPGKRERRSFRKEMSAGGSLGLGWKAAAATVQPSPAKESTASEGTGGPTTGLSLLSVPSADWKGTDLRRAASSDTIWSDASEARPGRLASTATRGGGAGGEAAAAEGRYDLTRSTSGEDRARGRVEGAGPRLGHHVWDMSLGQSKALPLLDMPVREVDESALSPQDESPYVFGLSQRKAGVAGTGAVSHDQDAYLAPASALTRRLSSKDSVDSAPPALGGSFPHSARDEDDNGRTTDQVTNGKRRALSPSFFGRSPSKRSAALGHDVEASDETILDRLRRRPTASTDADADAGVDRDTRASAAGSWSSASPQSTIQRSAGGRLPGANGILGILVKPGDDRRTQRGLLATDSSPLWPEPGATADEAESRSGSPRQLFERTDPTTGEEAMTRDVGPSHVSLRSSVGIGLPTSATVTAASSSSPAGHHLRFPGRRSIASRDGGASGGGGVGGYSRRLPIHASGMHSRDYSRASRISRASTVGTFTTMGTNATEGSFGVSGSVRDRFAMTFFASNSLRRPKLSRAGSSRHSRGGPLKLHRARTDSALADSTTPLRAISGTAQQQRRLERDASLASSRRARTRNLSADSQVDGSHGRHSRASSIGGVPAGAVGTSGGGTKWVGQSFEIGGCLVEVLEERKAKIAEHAPCLRAAAVVGSTVADRTAAGIMKKASNGNLGGGEGKGGGPSKAAGLTPGTSEGRSPSAVISLMAAEAQDATHERIRSEERQEKVKKQRLPGAASTSASELPATLRSSEEIGRDETGVGRSAGDAKSSAGRMPNGQVGSLPAGERRSGGTAGRQDGLRSSVTSHSQEHGNAEDASDIESRQGWKDVASAITALSRPSVGVRQSRTSAAADLAEGVTHRPANDAAASTKGLAPPMLRQRTSSLKTEAESEGASHYTDAITDSDEGQVVGRRMTRAEALTHPDPPLEADEKFPELTHALLRRPSDDGSALPTRLMSDAASDHAVAVQPIASLQGTTFGSDRLGATPEAPAAPAAASRGSKRDPSSRLDSADPSQAESLLLGNVNGHARLVSVQASSVGVAASHRSSSPNSTHLLLAPQRTSSQRPWPLSPGPIVSEPDKQQQQQRPLRDERVNISPRKKMVQFDAKPPLRRGFTASLFAQKSQDDTAFELNAFGGSSKSRIGSDDAVPVPPDQVLARPMPSTPSPSAELQKNLGARRDPKVDFTLPLDPTDEVITRKSVLKKDRMLVKLAWTVHEDLPRDFDELAARKYAIRDEEWREYVVVLRMGKLELWGDATFANKAVGHGDRLKLRHTISLSRGSTFMSVYSPIDRIFCLTHQPWKASSSHHARNRLHLRRHGTEIALFDCRVQTVALDWMWELWRKLGGIVPETIDVHLASIGVKVRIAIPDEVTAEHVGRMPSESSGYRPAGEGGGGKASRSRPPEPLQIGGEGYATINKIGVINVLQRLARTLPDGREVLEYGGRQGLRLELAWRRGNVLDWVMYERTVDGQARPWAIVAGSILKEYRTPSILELRAGVHYPINVRLATGTVMDEPPAIEGFLWRVKPVSGYLTRLYVATHDGHMFICKPSRACPPDRYLFSQLERDRERKLAKSTTAKTAASTMTATTTTKTQPRQKPTAAPGHKSAAYKALARFLGREKAVRREESVAALRRQVQDALSWPAESEEELHAQIDAFKAFEKRRQFEQICGSDGYIDLRSIWMIRAVGKGPVRCPGDDDTKLSGLRGGAAALRRVQADQEAAPHEGELSDDDGDGDNDGGDDEADIGGEEGIAAATDKAQMRQARQIEIVLANGRTIRVEAYSKSVAREWIERISELVKYWRRREKADALDLMNASGYDMAVINRKLQRREAVHDHHIKVSDEKISPVLSNIWHWCAIESCRGIIKCGRLFHKHSSYAPFQSRYYLLIAGRLLSFKLVKSQRTARSRQNAGIFHRRQERVIHLRDAYVYSGRLTEDMLANGRSEPAQAIGGVGGGGSNSCNRHRIPRVYGDGLFSFDEDEDCTLVVRYRPERINTPVDPPAPDFAASSVVASAALARGKRYAAPSTSCGVGGGGVQSSSILAAAAAATTISAATSIAPSHQQHLAPSSGNKAPAAPAAGKGLIPKLEDKTHRYIALRARNKLERDQWVRCIANAIETIVREDGEREEKMKNTGRVDF